MIRIIDNKRIELTDSEWQMYQKIAKSYDKPNFNGKDLFKDLIETDDNGIIICLKPPSTKYSSMEVFLFFVSVFVHQHVGISVANFDRLSTALEMQIQRAEQLINDLENIKK